MNNENIKLTINISKNNYHMLDDMLGAIDMSPSTYIEKFLQKRLFKNNDKTELEPDKEDNEFKLMQKNMTLYGIKQVDIANYFKVSPSNVSIFFKKENKKSHLYPKFFTHSTAKGLLYNIYINKYLLEFSNLFEEYEQEEIKEVFINLHNEIAIEEYEEANEDEKYMLDNAEEYSDKHNDEYTKEEILYRDNMIIIASVLSVLAKYNDVDDFDIYEFINLVRNVKYDICDIEHNELNNKDLDYFHSKIVYILKYL